MELGIVIPRRQVQTTSELIKASENKTSVHYSSKNGPVTGSAMCILHYVISITCIRKLLFRWRDCK